MAFFYMSTVSSTSLVVAFDCSSISFALLGVTSIGYSADPPWAVVTVIQLPFFSTGLRWEPDAKDA